MADGNPLVAQERDTTTAVTGIGIAESAQGLANGISNGDWVEAGLSAAGVGLEVLSMVIDPLGTLASYGVSWLIEHVRPLKEALDWFAGDPPVIQSFSETWGNVATEVNTVAQDYLREAGAGTAGWTGQAGDAYRGHAAEAADALAGAATLADGISVGVMIMGEVVAFVREFIRDLVGELVGRLIAWALQVAATLGLATPAVVAQATAAITRVVNKVADVVRKLVKTIGNVSPRIRKIIDKLDEIIAQLAKLMRRSDGSTTPSSATRPADGAPTVHTRPDGTSPSSTTDTPTSPSSTDTPSSTRPSDTTSTPDTTTPNGDAPGSGRPGTSTDSNANRPGNGNDGGSGQRSDGNGGCDGRGGDPVDTVSGQVIINGVDVDLPALLPLTLQRAYASGYQGGRLHGPGWSSTLDQRLEIDEGFVRYLGDDAQILRYDRPEGRESRSMPYDGARWPLTWDEDTDTFRVEDPKTGVVRHFGPSTGDRGVRPITATTDRNGNRIDYHRDHHGLPTQVVHSGGYRITVDTINGDAGPRISALRLGTDNSVLVEYRYDHRGRLTDIVDATRLPYRYEYDEANRVNAWVDREGYRYGYTYREDGRVVRGEGQGGYLTAEFDYDLANRTTTVTDGLGGTTVFHYDEFNHLTKVVDPVGNAELTTYDRYHRLLSRTDALGNTTTYTLGWDGDPVRIDRPDGTAVTAAYNDLRQPVEVVGPDGARWGYTYDERGNVLTRTDPSGATTRHTYGDRGEPRTITDALGNTTTIVTDAAGLPVSVTDASGATETYVLDARGRLVEVTNPLGAVTTVEWGNADSPSRYTYPDGTSQTWITNGNGDVIATTDRAGFTTRYEIGPFHTISARIDPDGARHEFVHDGELRLTEVLNPQRLIWRYTYDPAGNLLREQDFNGRTMSYEYDAAKLVVSLTNGAGESITITRDPFGRPVAQRTGDGEVSTIGYDAAGRVLTATSPGAELVFTRDPVGRLLTETVNGATLTNAYDPLGRRTSRTTPSGHTSIWRYDRIGLPAALTTGGTRLTFGHDAAGREAYRWLGPEVAVTSTWDDSGRLTARQLVEVDGPNGVSRLRFGRSWTYRADGVPGSMTDSFDGSRRFALDPVGRVTAVQAATWNERYAYDASGNLAFAVDSRAADSPEAGPRSAEGTLVRRAGRTHYDHDAQGRLVRTVRHTLSGSRQVWTFRYDTRGRIVETTNPAGQRWLYQYDPLGRRIGKRRLDSGGAVAEEVRFHWDAQVLAEQQRVLNGTVATTTWDHEPGSWTPISQDHRTSAANAPQHVIDRQFHAIVTDLVGTPTELVTTDGRVEWRHQASLWGEERGGRRTVDCPLRFPGQYHDRETGLYYNYHRYYDPATGRYTSPDPLGLDAAPNHHGYVENPLALFDPVGLISRDRYLHMDRPGWSNYVLRDANGNVYYSGQFGPGATQADVEARHMANHNRYNPANGDTIEVLPGTRTYGESSLMEQRLAEQYGTVIGRDGNNYRGNRQNPMTEDRLAEYEEYEQRRNSGLGCP
jgi:RHS repeat-associated protein